MALAMQQLTKDGGGRLKHYGTEQSFVNYAETTGDRSFGALSYGSMKNPQLLGFKDTDEAKKNLPVAMARNATGEIVEMSRRIFLDEYDKNGGDIASAYKAADSWQNEKIKAISGFSKDAPAHAQNAFVDEVSNISYTNAKGRGGYNYNGEFIPTHIDRNVDVGNKVGAFLWHAGDKTLVGTTLGLITAGLTGGGFSEGRSMLSALNENAQQADHKMLSDNAATAASLIGYAGMVAEFYGASAFAAGRYAMAANKARSLWHPSRAMSAYILAKTNADTLSMSAGLNRKYFRGNNQQNARWLDLIASNTFEIATYGLGMRFTGPLVNNAVRKLIPLQKAGALAIEPLINTLADSTLDTALDYGFHRTGSALFNPLGIEYTAQQIQQFGDLKNFHRDLIFRIGMRAGNRMGAHIIRGTGDSYEEQVGKSTFWANRMGLGAVSSKLTAMVHRLLPSDLGDVMREYDSRIGNIAGGDEQFTRALKAGKISHGELTRMFLLAERVQNKMFDSLFQKPSDDDSGFLKVNTRRVLDVMSLRSPSIGRVLFGEDPGTIREPGSVIEFDSIRRMGSHVNSYDPNATEENVENYWRSVFRTIKDSDGVRNPDGSINESEARKAADVMRNTLDFYVNQGKAKEGVQARNAEIAERVAREEFGEEWDGGIYKSRLSDRIYNTVVAPHAADEKVSVTRNDASSRMFASLLENTKGNPAIKAWVHSLDSGDVERIRRMAQGDKEALEKAAEERGLSQEEEDMKREVGLVIDALKDEGYFDKNPDDMGSRINLSESVISYAEKAVMRIVSGTEKMISASGVDENMKRDRVYADVHQIMAIQSTLGAYLGPQSQLRINDFFKNNRSFLNKIDWSGIVTNDMKLFVKHYFKGKQEDVNGIDDIMKYSINWPTIVRANKHIMAPALTSNNGKVPLSVYRSSVDGDDRGILEKIIVTRGLDALSAVDDKTGQPYKFEDIEINGRDAQLDAEYLSSIPGTTSMIIAETTTTDRSAQSPSRTLDAVDEETLERNIAASVAYTVWRLKHENPSVTPEQVRLEIEHFDHDDLIRDVNINGDKISVTTNPGVLSRARAAVEFINSATTMRARNTISYNTLSDAVLADLTKPFAIGRFEGTSQDLLDRMDDESRTWLPSEAIASIVRMSGDEATAERSVKKYLNEFHAEYMSKMSEDDRTIFVRNLVRGNAIPQQVQQTFDLTEYGRYVDVKHSTSGVRGATVVDVTEGAHYYMATVALHGFDMSKGEEIKKVMQDWSKNGIVVLGPVGANNNFQTIVPRKVTGVANRTYMDEARLLLDAIRSTYDRFGTLEANAKLFWWSPTVMARDIMQSMGDSFGNTFLDHAEKGRSIKNAIAWFFKGDDEYDPSSEEGSKLWPGLTRIVEDTQRAGEVDEIGDAQNVPNRAERINREYSGNKPATFTELASNMVSMLEKAERLMDTFTTDIAADFADATMDRLALLEKDIDGMSDILTRYAEKKKGEPTDVSPTDVADMQQATADIDNERIGLVREALNLVNDYSNQIGQRRLPAADLAMKIDSHSLFLETQDIVNKAFESGNRDYLPLIEQRDMFRAQQKVLKEKVKSVNNPADENDARVSLYSTLFYGEKYLTLSPEKMKKYGNQMRHFGSFLDANGRLIEAYDKAIDNASKKSGGYINVILTSAQDVEGVPDSDGFIWFMHDIIEAGSSLGMTPFGGTKCTFGPRSSQFKLMAGSSRMLNDGEFKGQANVFLPGGRVTTDNINNYISDDSLILTTDVQKVLGPGFFAGILGQEGDSLIKRLSDARQDGKQSVVFRVDADAVKRMFSLMSLHTSVEQRAQKISFGLQAQQTDPFYATVAQRQMKKNLGKIRSNILSVPFSGDAAYYRNRLYKAAQKDVRGDGYYGKFVPMRKKAVASHLDVEFVDEKTINNMPDANQHMSHNTYLSFESVRSLLQTAKRNNRRLEGRITNVLDWMEQRYSTYKPAFSDEEQAQARNIYAEALEVLTKTGLLDKDEKNGFYYGLVTRSPAAMYGHAVPSVIRGIRGPWKHAGIEASNSLIRILGGDFDGDGVMLIPMGRDAYDISKLPQKYLSKTHAYVSMSAASNSVLRSAGKLGLSADPDQISYSMDEFSKYTMTTGQAMAGIKLGQAWASMLYSKAISSAGLTDLHESIRQSVLNTMSSAERPSEVSQELFKFNDTEFKPDMMSHVILDTKSYNTLGAWRIEGDNDISDDGAYRIIRSHLRDEEVIDKESKQKKIITHYAVVLLKKDGNGVGYKQIGYIPTTVGGNLTANDLMSYYGKIDRMGQENTDEARLRVMADDYGSHAVITPNARTVSSAGFVEQINSSGVDVASLGSFMLREIATKARYGDNVSEATRDFSSRISLTSSMYVTDTVGDKYLTTLTRQIGSGSDDMDTKARATVASKTADIIKNIINKYKERGEYSNNIPTYDEIRTLLLPFGNSKVSDKAFSDAMEVADRYRGILNIENAPRSTFGEVIHAVYALNQISDKMLYDMQESYTERLMDTTALVDYKDNIRFGRHKADQFGITDVDTIDPDDYSYRTLQLLREMRGLYSLGHMRNDAEVYRHLLKRNGIGLDGVENLDELVTMLRKHIIEHRNMPMTKQEIRATLLDLGVTFDNDYISDGGSVIKAADEAIRKTIGKPDSETQIEFQRIIEQVKPDVTRKLSMKDTDGKHISVDTLISRMESKLREARDKAANGLSVERRRRIYTALIHSMSPETQKIAYLRARGATDKFASILLKQASTLTRGIDDGGNRLPIEDVKQIFQIIHRIKRQPSIIDPELLPEDIISVRESANDVVIHNIKEC